jgi:hypothetical protein
MKTEEIPNPVFREHVTSGAFQMTLSKTMLACLTAIWHGDRAYMTCVRDHVTAFNGLQRRGLTYHLDETAMHKAEVDAGLLSPHLVRYLGDWMMTKPDFHFTKLTRAGELMCLLLIEAGMLTERVRKPDVIEV